jgi:diaminohydroxyphosphoribosylaminopyrimidine deaminase/5-amino-6-(5-phosphoribosylamino)uracil reductase
MNPTDYGYMRMAYGLARAPVGRVSPNPYVGAVIVRDAVTVGAGFHEGPGKPHAEIVALRQAGIRARGATLYVTLEPCVHWGRTPPCVDSLLAAGLRRVVISDLDPNPLVLRRGLRRLKAEGLEVEWGLLREENRRLNEAYIKYITRRIPFVTVKAAVSLDGRMATRTGDSRWISSPPAREYVHFLRRECDALMVGLNTVLRDDPRLTVRLPHGKGKLLTRVVLDARLRLPLEARLFSTLAPRSPLVVFAGRGASPARAAALEKKGARVVRVPDRNGRLDLGAVLAWLGGKEIAHVLVEGGGLLASSLLEARLADKVVLALSPKLLGGREAPAFIAGRGAARIADALSLRDVRSFSLGSDVIVEGYL